MKHVLFLCTGNSCRSIMAEALLNHHGKGMFEAFSAGSQPTGTVHPMSLATLKAHKITDDNYRSKSWDEFATQQIDIVITVCDNAAGEACPVFFGAPVKAHWGTPDPAHFQGTTAEKEGEFIRVYAILERRIKSLIALPLDTLDKTTLHEKLTEIGRQ